MHQQHEGEPDGKKDGKSFPKLKAGDPVQVVPRSHHFFEYDGCYGVIDSIYWTGADYIATVTYKSTARNGQRKFPISTLKRLDRPDE